MRNSIPRMISCVVILTFIVIDCMASATEDGINPEFKLKEERASADCQRDVLDKPYPQDGNLYCNRTFDGWGCWGDTLAGTRAFLPCPVWVNQGFSANQTAFKDCGSDGQWWHHPITEHPWTNYTTCIDRSEFSHFSA